MEKILNQIWMLTFLINDNGIAFTGTQSKLLKH